MALLYGSGRDVGEGGYSDEVFPGLLWAWEWKPLLVVSVVPKTGIVLTSQLVIGRWCVIHTATRSPATGGIR